MFVVVWIVICELNVLYIFGFECGWGLVIVGD